MLVDWLDVQLYFTDAEKVRRAKLAAERRAKVMAQMKAQMNNFISNNATLFEETTTEVRRTPMGSDFLSLSVLHKNETKR